VRMEAIGYNYYPDVRDVPARVRVNRARRLGADDGVTKLWSQSPEEMVKELNAFRRRALGGSEAAAEATPFA